MVDPVEERNNRFRELRMDSRPFRERKRDAIMSQLNDFIKEFDLLNDVEQKTLIALLQARRIVRRAYSVD